MRLYKRIKNVSSLVLIILLFGGSISNTFANTEMRDFNGTTINEKNVELQHKEMESLAYELRDEFNKRPDDSSDNIIKDVYIRNKSLVDNVMEKASISENELLAFVSENPNSNAVKSTFKNRSQSYIKEFYKDTKMLGEFVREYEHELKEYYDTSGLEDYTFTLDDGRILSIQGLIIGIDEPIQDEKIATSRAYTSTRSHSRIYRSWTGLKLFTINAKGYFSYNNSTLPVGYPDAVDTYVQKAALSRWQINEWSEGAQQDPKGGYTKIYGAGSFYLGFDVGGGSLHFDTMKGEAGLKCDKTGYVWTYSYY